MMRLRPHPNCKRAMHFPLDLQATNRCFPPSPHTIIQDPSDQLCRHRASNHRPGKGSLRKFQLQAKITSFSVKCEVHTTSLIHRHILRKLEQFLLQKSYIHLSCKTTFECERTNHLIIQHCTQHICSEL
jgi:hypothetical protein